VPQNQGGLAERRVTPQVKLMAGERELATGMLAKEAGFRLIVMGKSSAAVAN
jgi:hypothetical protein